MTDFAALHRPGDPLVLPNAWDVASARALAAAGFAAIGTTSLGVAAAHGLPDGRGQGKTETHFLVRQLRGGLGVPLTVDIEGGFGGSPEEVAEYAAALHDDGAAGVNIEDGPGDPAAAITAIKNRCPDLFVNARTDTYWLGTGDLAETITRCRAYLAAGADGVFVPAIADDAEIRTLTGEIPAPVNVLLLPGMTVAHLAGLGVARVSTGSLLYRTALWAAVRAAREIAAGGSVVAAGITYAEADDLAAGR